MLRKDPPRRNKGKAAFNDLERNPLRLVVVPFRSTKMGKARTDCLVFTLKDFHNSSMVAFEKRTRALLIYDSKNEVSIDIKKYNNNG